MMFLGQNIGFCSTDVLAFLNKASIDEGHINQIHKKIFCKAAILKEINPEN